MATDTNKPVNVAVVTYVSGRAAAPFGFPARNAAELMVESINAGGVLPEPYASPGFAGRKLSLRVYDESGSEDEQIEQLRRIQADGADIVVGYPLPYGAQRNTSGAEFNWLTERLSPKWN